MVKISVKEGDIEHLNKLIKKLKIIQINQSKIYKEIVYSYSMEIKKLKKKSDELNEKEIEINHKASYFQL